MRIINTSTVVRRALALACVWAVGSIWACGSDGSGFPAPTPSSKPSTPAPGNGDTYVALDPALGPTTRAYVLRHVSESIGAGYRTVDGAAEPELKAGDSVIAFGETKLTRKFLAKSELTSLKEEGIALRGGEANGVRFLVADGKGASELVHKRAVGFAAYQALERLGHRFLHPLEPTIGSPTKLSAAAFSQNESPRFRIRGLQLHTMHPIELCDVLNGWGASGPDDAAGWEAMLPEWERYLEWMIANKQNRVHWLLLEADSWATFAQSPTRQARLKKLVDIAHDYGIEVGVDVPIALQQQHTFRLLRKQGVLADELAQIRERVDWLLAAGFDYLATENGTTEFTHPPPARMLAWMNELARHVDEAHGHKPTYIKIHASTGQTAAGFIDPRTGSPINFNFLPHFADRRLGVMPHTVQHYGLDDSAPTYGNTNFGFMRDFLHFEAGKREVVWHPETAYWVSFDIDVPLFLPVYAERRLHDLRLLAHDEAMGKMGGPLDGQLTFSSGWEWGYWLNDVVAARASWNPEESASSDREAFVKILTTLFAPDGNDTGISAGDLATAIADAATMQKQLLIDGQVAGRTPSTPVRRNGQAYMQGFEAWDDMSALGQSIPGFDNIQMTQPERLGLVEMRTPLHLPPRYTSEVSPLLAALVREHAALHNTLRGLAGRVQGTMTPIVRDLADSAEITALRARQIYGLYDYVDLLGDFNPAARLARLQDARAALDEAARVVTRREKAYRVPVARVSGWHPNPTSYPFGYLWSVHSLYYFWRDEGKAVDGPRSPCYLNILNIADIGMGEGIATDSSRVARDILTATGQATTLAECLSEPPSEPIYPPAGLRTRP